MILLSSTHAMVALQIGRTLRAGGKDNVGAQQRGHIARSRRFWRKWRRRC